MVVQPRSVPTRRSRRLARAAAQASSTANSLSKGRSAGSARFPPRERPSHRRERACRGQRLSRRSRRLWMLCAIARAVPPPADCARRSRHRIRRPRELPLRAARAFHASEAAPGATLEEQFHEDSYGYRPGTAHPNRRGKFFVDFSPGMSAKAGKRMRKEMRGWKLPLRRDQMLQDPTPSRTSASPPEPGRRAGAPLEVRASQGRSNRLRGTRQLNRERPGMAGRALGRSFRRRAAISLLATSQLTPSLSEQHWD